MWICVLFFPVTTLQSPIHSYGFSFEIAAILDQDMLDLGKFMPPSGRLLHATVDHHPAGVACLKSLEQKYKNEHVPLKTSAEKPDTPHPSVSDAGSLFLFCLSISACQSWSILMKKDRLIWKRMELL